MGLFDFLKKNNEDKKTEHDSNKSSKKMKNI